MVPEQGISIGLEGQARSLHCNGIQSVNSFIAEVYGLQFVCLADPAVQLLSLRIWHDKQGFQGLQAAANKHRQQQNLPLQWLFAAGVVAGSLGCEAHCEASSYAEDHASRSWWSKHVDPRLLFHAKEHNVFLDEMQSDIKVTYWCRSPHSLACACFYDTQWYCSKLCNVSVTQPILH